MKWAQAIFIPGLLILGLLVSAGRGGCSSEPLAPAIKKAPDFTLDLFGEGPQRQLTLSEFSRDRPVLLVFWASWCPTCISEIKALNAWQTKNSALGVRVLGVNLEDTPDKIRRVQERFPMDYGVVMDRDGVVAERYNVDSLPTLVLLAKGGEILYYGFQLPRDLERLISART